MGQYYIAIILADEPKKEPNKEYFEEETIKAVMCPCGCKLMEHSYIGNSSVSRFEFSISPQGSFHKSRVVWAGDYADNELNMDINLYHMSCNKNFMICSNNIDDTTKFRYIVNHTNMQFVDKNKIQGAQPIHPLPLLTCEGNGRGGGDFFADDRGLVGAWARDVISVEEEIPDGYVEIIFDLVEEN
jgi:hypothetical protein